MSKGTQCHQNQCKQTWSRPCLPSHNVIGSIPLWYDSRSNRADLNFLLLGDEVSYKIFFSGTLHEVKPSRILLIQYHDCTTESQSPTATKELLLQHKAECSTSSRLEPCLILVTSRIVYYLLCQPVRPDILKESTEIEKKHKAEFFWFSC